MKHSFIFLILVIFSITNTTAQLTIENIWKTYEYYPFGISNVHHSNSGNGFYMLESNRISYVPYRNEKAKTVVDCNGKTPTSIQAITLSPDEHIILAATDVTYLRRNSFSAIYYMYSIASDSLQAIFSNNTRIQNPTFSPQNNEICYFFENNLYIYNFKDSAFAITTNGKTNEIINGMPDWVSEEEFDITQAFMWSPQGTHIAYLQWDERNVPDYYITKYDSVYPQQYLYKYPKAGENPAQVTAKIYNVVSQKTTSITFPIEYSYIPEFTWIDSTRVAFTLLNRLQNKLDIAVYSLLTNSCTIVYSYSSNTFVDIPTHFTPIDGTDNFIVRNDSDGFLNLYSYSYSTGLIAQLTKNIGEVTDVYGYFRGQNTLMFQATNNNPLERYVFELQVQSGEHHIISNEPGTHSIDVNKFGTGWIREFSDKSPLVVIYIEGKHIDSLRQPYGNYWMQDLARKNKFQPVEFFTIPTEGNELLHANMIKPKNFKKNKQYPVVVSVYGGPSMQKVANQWTYDYYWSQFLAQQGYIVVSVDCRGTDGRGSAFRKQTYMNLGDKESYDFAATATHLRTLPYVNKSNIAIQGWSYGAYMALLTAAKYPTSYNAVIAIAPVTKWQLYDNIYTERYMQTPDANPQGYTNSSIFTYLHSITAPILVAHGTADDNVHIQNTFELVSKLIAYEKDFEILVFPNDEHSLFGENSRMYLYSKYFEFLEKHIK